jgi:ABC-type transport system involved in multi-copper enzyme maturation permease subunit
MRMILIIFGVVTCLAGVVVFGVSLTLSGAGNQSGTAALIGLGLFVSSVFPFGLAVIIGLLTRIAQNTDRPRPFVAKEPTLAANRIPPSTLRTPEYKRELEKP